MTTTKISALLLTFAVILSIVGLTYAHWSDTVQIEGTVKMAHIRVGIKSEKVLMSKDIQKYSTVTYTVSPDEHSMAIYSKNLKPCWYIWVGLVLQNQGTLLGRIKPPEYSFEDPDGFKDYFETTEYFYGPYPEETGFGTLEEWGKVKIGEQLLPDGTVTFTKPSTPVPFDIDPTEKAIMWIWIHCRADLPPSAMGKTVTMYITIVDDIAI